MDKDQAIHEFWSGFGLDAFDENTVLTGVDAPITPYITYNVATGSLEDVIPLYGNLWYRSASWMDISAKAQEISDFIGNGGYTIKINGGYLWITRGTPFSQRMSDPGDDLMRRIYINISVEFLTEN